MHKKKLFLKKSQIKNKLTQIATLIVETIPNDKIHKKKLETNYRTPCVQLILFRILYDFVDLQI